MGTRGAVGWKINNEYFAIYKQGDSYPSGLGFWICEFLNRIKDLDFLRRRLEKVEKIKIWINDDGCWEVEEVHRDKLRTWDRNKAVGYLDEIYGEKIDHVFIREPCFLRDSIMCEYAYVIDFDDEKLMYFTNDAEDDENNSPLPAEWWKHPLIFPELKNLDNPEGKYYPVGYVDSFRIDGNLNYRDFVIAGWIKKNNLLSAKLDKISETIIRHGLDVNEHIGQYNTSSCGASIILSDIFQIIGMDELQRRSRLMRGGKRYR